MSHRCRPVAAMLIALWIGLGEASAQGVVQDFGSLASRVQTGDELIVEDAEGTSVRGQIVALSPTELMLLVSGAPTTFGVERITVATHAYRDPRRTGALVGLAVGVALGAMVGRSLMGEYEQDVRAGDAAVIALEFGAVGAGAGFLIDALVPGRKVVYRRTPQRASRE